MSFEEFLILAGVIVVIGSIATYFQFKKKIEQVGTVRCSRCGHTGVPKQGGTVYSPKIVCASCSSDQWQKVQ